MRIQSAGEQPAVVISVEIKKITQKKEIRFGCGHHGNGPDIRRILRPDRVYDGVVVLHVKCPIGKTEQLKSSFIK
jgi:hypothetical protein